MCHLEFPDGIFLEQKVLWCAYEMSMMYEDLKMHIVFLWLSINVYTKSRKHAFFYHWYFCLSNIKDFRYNFVNFNVWFKNLVKITCLVHFQIVHNKYLFLAVLYTNVIHKAVIVTTFSRYQFFIRSSWSRKHMYH